MKKFINKSGQSIIVFTKVLQTTHYYQIVYFIKIKISKMKTFFKSFANSASVVLIVGLFVITFKQKSINEDYRSTIDSLTLQIDSIKTDTTFGEIILQRQGKSDSTLIVTNIGVIDNILTLNQMKPTVQDIVIFTNWAAPIIDAVAEQSKLKDKDGIRSFTTFKVWFEDQKQLAAERAKQKQKE